MDTKTCNPYKLPVPLVQMTPVFHFQAKEAGATLRATEIKPKLDRFLIHAVFHDNETLYKKYVISSQSNGENSGADANDRLMR